MELMFKPKNTFINAFCNLYIEVQLVPSPPPQRLFWILYLFCCSKEINWSLKPILYNTSELNLARKLKVKFKMKFKLELCFVNSPYSCRTLLFNSSGDFALPLTSLLLHVLTIGHFLFWRCHSSCVFSIKAVSY